MPASPQLSIRPRHAALHTGVYAGVALSVIFVAWLFVANRIPALEQVALERNLVAAVLLAVVALFPVARFFARPGAAVGFEPAGLGDFQPDVLAPFAVL